MTWTIRDYPYIKCRAVAHYWDDFDPLIRRRDGTFLTLYCPDCTTSKTATINRATGQPLDDWDYTYPDDYKDVEAVADKAEWRKEYIRRRAAKANGKG